MESGAFNGSYDFSSRFKGGSGTNPEEFDAAPHAGCFSMALATRAHQRRTPAEPRHDDRESHIEKKKGAFAISLIELETEGDVPGIDDQTFGSRHKPRRTGASCRRHSPAWKIRLVGARLVASQTLTDRAFTIRPLCSVCPGKRRY
jgi:lipoyl-dependent peroxiredoxin